MEAKGLLGGKKCAEDGERFEKNLIIVGGGGIWDK
jgi:hypothetical protein